MFIVSYLFVHITCLSYWSHLFTPTRLFVPYICCSCTFFTWNQWVHPPNQSRQLLLQIIAIITKEMSKLESHILLIFITFTYMQMCRSVCPCTRVLCSRTVFMNLYFVCSCVKTIFYDATASCIKRPIVYSNYYTFDWVIVTWLLGWVNSKQGISMKFQYCQSHSDTKRLLTNDTL